MFYALLLTLTRFYVQFASCYEFLRAFINYFTILHITKRPLNIITISNTIFKMVCKIMFLHGILEENVDMMTKEKKETS